jgi:hypothetical protein
VKIPLWVWFLVGLILGLLLTGCDKGEILIEHGTVVSKTYVSGYTSTISIPQFDGEGHLTGFDHVPYHVPAKHIVKIEGPSVIFTMNNVDVFGRFPEGSKVKVTYWEKRKSVQHVYGEDEQIPVEGN